jgi:hypothetical protein
MVLKPAWITGWTGQHVRHAAALFRQGQNPVARVYESMRSDFFLAPAQGWLNLGLWEGPGSEGEAEDACRRLVTTLASALPAGGVILDAGNGLGTQEPLIAGVVRPRRLVAVNITEWQLMAGRERLREAAGRRTPALVAGKPALAAPHNRLSAAPRRPPITDSAEHHTGSDCPPTRPGRTGNNQMRLQSSRDRGIVRCGTERRHRGNHPAAGHVTAAPALFCRDPGRYRILRPLNSGTARARLRLRAATRCAPARSCFRSN